MFVTATCSGFLPRLHRRSPSDYPHGPQSSKDWGTALTCVAIALRDPQQAERQISGLLIQSLDRLLKPHETAKRCIEPVTASRMLTLIRVQIACKPSSFSHRDRGPGRSGAYLVQNS